MVIVILDILYILNILCTFHGISLYCDMKCDSRRLTFTGLALFESMSSSVTADSEGTCQYLSVADTSVAAPYDCPPLPAACLALGELSYYFIPTLVFYSGEEVWMLWSYCLGHVNEYPIVHYFGNPRHTQSIIAYMILTGYFWKFQWKIASWECCLTRPITCS